MTSPSPYGPAVQTNPGPPKPESAHPHPWRLSFAGLLRSELLKMTSMTSTWVLIGLSILLGLLTSAMFNSIFASYVSYDDNNTGPSTLQFASQTILGAPFFPGAFMTMLGIMAITNEYESGMIRTTLTITPARWPALVAKTVMVAGFGFGTAAVGEFIGAVLGWLFSGGHMTFDLFTGRGLHAWLGSSAAVMLFALMGLAWGIIVRRAVIAALIQILGITLVLPYLLALVLATSITDVTSDSWTAIMYEPFYAGFFMYAFPILESLASYDVSSDLPMSTVGAVIAMIAWTAIPLAGGYFRFQASD